MYWSHWTNPQNLFGSHVHTHIPKIKTKPSRGFSKKHVGFNVIPSLQFRPPIRTIFFFFFFTRFHFPHHCQTKQKPVIWNNDSAVELFSSKSLNTFTAEAFNVRPLHLFWSVGSRKTNETCSTIESRRFRYFVSPSWPFVNRTSSKCDPCRHFHYNFHVVHVHPLALCLP